MTYQAEIDLLKQMFYQVALATEKKRAQLEKLEKLGDKFHAS